VSVDDPDGYFEEPVAAGYDDPAGRMFQPQVIDPAVKGMAGQDPSVTTKTSSERSRHSTAPGGLPVGKASRPGCHLSPCRIRLPIASFLSVAHRRCVTSRRTDRSSQSVPGI
jgi:hypothetical protein